MTNLTATNTSPDALNKAIAALCVGDTLMVNTYHTRGQLTVNGHGVKDGVTVIFTTNNIGQKISLWEMSTNWQLTRPGYTGGQTIRLA
jgi:hypothetical protein